MKQIVKMVVVLVTGCLVFASCSKNEPASKCISAREVRISGTHKNLLAVTDSVKIILTCTDEKEDEWDVRAIIPLVNTKLWKDVPGIEPAVKPKRSYTYFEPQMGNLSAEYQDDNDSPISYDLGVDWDVIKSLLSSGDTKTPENFVLKSRWSYGDHSYKTMKGIYDKVAKISITKADLDEVEVEEPSSSSRSSNSYYDDDDLDEALDQYERALNAAGKALDMLDDF